MSSNFTVNKVCEHCGNIFSAKTTVTRFCSHRCNSRNYKQKLREEKITVSNQAVRQVIGHKLEELTNLEFLSVKAAAKLLGASDKIVHTMIKSGRLKATNLSVRKTVINRADIDRLFEISEIKDERKPNSSNLSECCHMGVYFGETDHPIPWQTDHLNCWRTDAANAVEACTKIVI